MTPPESWDVVVVGAGPAGSAAAIAAKAARPAARVLMLDSSAFPRDKVCGDGVAPHALDVLESLGVDRDALVAGSEPVTRLRMHSPGGAVVVRDLARPAHTVRRAVFDDRLVQAAIARGGELRQHVVRSVVPTDDGAVVDGIRAGVVIGADGAESVVRRAVGAGRPRAGTVALALRGYVRADAWPAGEQLLTMTARSWPAYAWAFPIGDGWANVGYGELLRNDPPSRAHLVRRLHELLPATVGARRLRGHRLPLSTGRPDVGWGRVLLAGDAASLINPMTGEGIFYAVASGALAGAAALEADPAGTYRDALRACLGVHLRHTDAIARLTRWPRVIDAGIAAAREDQRVFDTLVEMGLGSGRLGGRSALGVARHLVSGRH